MLDLQEYGEDSWLDVDCGDKHILDILNDE
jgi:hypothetical protein